MCKSNTDRRDIKMKKIICLLLCVGVLLLFVACMAPQPSEQGQTKSSQSSSPTSSTSPAENISPTVFTVTLQYKGKPISENRPFMQAYTQLLQETGGIYAMWYGETGCHTALFDENGTAEITGLDGDYQVVISQLPDGYYYGVNHYWATNEKPNINIELYPIWYGEGPGTDWYFPYVSELPIPALYVFNIEGPEDVIYCKFTPDMKGVYSIISLASTIEDNINPMLDMYCATSDGIVYDYTLDDGTYESIYTKNFSYIFNVTADTLKNEDPTVFFAIRATAKDGIYPIQVYIFIQRAEPLISCYRTRPLH